MESENDLLYFVTSNKHKFNEIYTLYRKEQLKYKLTHLDLETNEIQAKNIKEIALFKLNSIRGKVDSSYFIEDAGFFVDKPLNGFPGVYSSFVMNKIGNEGILKLIDDFKHSEAHFTSVIALYFKPLKKSVYFEGIVKGKVSKTIRGLGGFGFDPIFLPNNFPNKTFAELSTDEKNNISHRGKAWRKFIDFLKKNS